MGASVYRDSQVVEIVGRNWLVNTLFDAGIEVARPERDRGVDLIAYVDRDRHFRAVPIQLKASTASAFSIDRKYAKTHELLLCFVWSLGKSQEDPSCISLTYAEAVEVGTDLGWTKTQSWLEGGKYSVNNPGSKVRRALEPFEMASPQDWQRRFGFR